ncbi:glycerophosphodiester phosphodiesterase [Arachnia propionica]|uniref:Glycerophosphodiester phosphodiesterase n=1 Tax=Arachnia propionica TaxID=1750 RepID=A0A3P1T487_9ACTN|nr:glycerophosphodiester phosphodiesterase [Arachnia propionica]MDO5084022.1 glycerophosphodiester phosphodiesterase [Arachnia propionica]RRD03313.1 glycerophosphodiester phosphodiesterase [Arachnia propionica]
MTAIWAHRGASAYAPENTIPAFKQAIEMGADGIEFDVQRSADGQLVVIHDETVNRTSNGVGKVVDLSLEQLRRCNFSNGFVGTRHVQIPTLKEVLELLEPTHVTINIELKNTVEFYPGMEHDVVSLVNEAGLQDRVIYSSFNHFSLANLRGVVPPERLGLLYSDGLYDPWKYANQFGAGALHPHFIALYQPNYMWLCHEAGVRVNTWTVDDDHAIKHLVSLGVDAVITNFPDRARRVIDRPWL